MTHCSYVQPQVREGQAPLIFTISSRCWINVEQNFKPFEAQCTADLHVMALHFQPHLQLQAESPIVQKPSELRRSMLAKTQPMYLPPGMLTCKKSRRWKPFAPLLVSLRFKQSRKSGLAESNCLKGSSNIPSWLLRPMSALQERNSSHPSHLHSTSCAHLLEHGRRLWRARPGQGVAESECCTLLLRPSLGVIRIVRRHPAVCPDPLPPSFRDAHVAKRHKRLAGVGENNTRNPL